MSDEDKTRAAWKVRDFLKNYGRSFSTPFSPVVVPPLQPKPASPMRGRHFDTIIMDDALFRGPTTEVTRRLYAVAEEVKTSFIAYGDVVVRATHTEDGFIVAILPPNSSQESDAQRKVIGAMKKETPSGNRHERRKNKKLARRKR